MFLKYLKEENKKCFLKLCVHAALANEVFATEEQRMIEEYCQEMNIPKDIPDTSESFEKVLQDIANNTNDMEKNIIVLEILGLIKADGMYDDKEKEFMEKLVKEIGVKEELLSKLNSLLEIYSTVCKEIYTTIIE